MGIIFGLASAFMQGVGHTVLKLSFNELPSSIAFFFEMLWGLVIWVPFALILGIDTSQLSQVFIYAFISAILSEAFVFFALSKGNSSISVTIFSTYPVFTILFSRYINDETLGMFVNIAIAVTILGILTISFPQKLCRRDFKKKLLLIFPLLAAITVGLSDSLSKNILTKTDPQTFLFCVAFMQIPVAFGYLFFERQRPGDITKIVKNLKNYKYSVISTFFLVSSLIFFWHAFDNTLASIASPLTGCYIIFVLIFSRVFLKEKICRKDMVGIVITIIGVLCVGALS